MGSGHGDISVGSFFTTTAAARKSMNVGQVVSRRNCSKDISPVNISSAVWVFGHCGKRMETQKSGPASSPGTSRRPAPVRAATRSLNDSSHPLSPPTSSERGAFFCGTSAVSQSHPMCISARACVMLTTGCHGTGQGLSGRRVQGPEGRTLCLSAC